MSTSLHFAIPSFSGRLDLCLKYMAQVITRAIRLAASARVLYSKTSMDSGLIKKNADCAASLDVITITAILIVSSRGLVANSGGSV